MKGTGYLAARSPTDLTQDHDHTFHEVNTYMLFSPARRNFSNTGQTRTFLIQVTLTLAKLVGEKKNYLL